MNDLSNSQIAFIGHIMFFRKELLNRGYSQDMENKRVFYSKDKIDRFRFADRKLFKEIRNASGIWRSQWAEFYGKISEDFLELIG
jgi:hypothetical protein